MQAPDAHRTSVGTVRRRPDVQPVVRMMCRVWGCAQKNSCALARNNVDVDESASERNDSHSAMPNARHRVQRGRFPRFAKSRCRPVAAMVAEFGKRLRAEDQGCAY